MKIVGPTTQLGNTTEFSLCKGDVREYCMTHIFPGIDQKRFLEVFKKDIEIESILECVSDAELYYIENDHGRGEELYYFGKENNLFHGEIIWSKYHDFLPFLPSIPVTATYDKPSLFVGSKNNYTHQLIDCLPSLLFFEQINRILSTDVNTFIFGKNNSILDTLMEIPSVNKSISSAEKLYLNSLGSISKVGVWQIRRITFKKLYLVKHLSIFKAFKLFKSSLESLNTEHISKQTKTSKNIVYLAREDKRVINQEEIINVISSRKNSESLRNIHKLTYREKQQNLKQYANILLPPGSDNINGLCFSNNKSRLIQMISTSEDNILNDPFTSYAGLRYLIPFMHRTKLLRSEPNSNITGEYSGKWNINDIHTCL